MTHNLTDAKAGCLQRPVSPPPPPANPPARSAPGKVRTAADLGLFDVADSGPQEEATRDERPRRHSFHESGSGAGARPRAGAAEQPQQQATQQQQVTSRPACVCCSANPQALPSRQLYQWPELLSSRSSRQAASGGLPHSHTSACHLQLQCTASLCTEDSSFWQPLCHVVSGNAFCPMHKQVSAAMAALSHDLRAGLRQRPGWGSCNSHSRAPAAAQAAAACRARSARWPPCSRAPTRAAC